MRERGEGVSKVKTIYDLFLRYKYVALVIVAGIVLLLLPTKESKEMSIAAPSYSEEEFSVAELENRLSAILSRIDGAGQVCVMLTAESGTRKVFAQDGVMDQKNESMRSEKETVIISSGAGMQETVLVQQIYPKFQGALVVAAGGDDPVVQLKLTEAVTALTGLGADKISVCKGK